MAKINNVHSQMYISRTKIYLAVIFVLLVVICVFQYKLIPLAIGLFTLIVIYANWTNKKRNAELDEQLKDLTLNVNTTAKTTLINSPFPLIMLETDGSVIWKSEKYVNEFAEADDEESFDNLVKQIKILIDNSDNKAKGKVETQYVVGNKSYTVLGSFVKAKKKQHSKEKKNDENQEYTTILYFIDDTEYRELQQDKINSDLCFGNIMIDNYEEVSQRMPNETRTLLLANIEKKIYDWAAKYDGVVIKADRDNFITIFTKENLVQALEDKISILDDIKTSDMSDDIRPTLSIAFSNNGMNNIEKSESAKELIGIALGRGGDQAIILLDGKHEYIGGRSQEVEKRTKVKARVVANSLKELIRESDNVLIMGHVNSDMDAIGSAMGIYRLARTLNVEAKVVTETTGIGLDKFLDAAKASGEYEDCFINKAEADEMATDNSLLVVVDTNKKTYVEDPDLLEKISKIVVIDHHRRSTDDIENPVLIFHEVYASSACELVTEIIEYFQENVELTQLEIEALYAGIMLDTKNFTFKTGVRTFEAAAYLRKEGVDIIKVKKWFQSDLETYQTISEIVSRAEVLNDNIAISTYDNDDPNGNIIAAKAADELLTIGGIVASFVLGRIGDTIYISGRSIGEVNVQLILEKLGGGGHITLAGAQLEGMDIEDAKQELIIRINEYFYESEDE